MEGAVAALATSAAALSVNPTPAAAKIERIKGGGPLVTLEDGATYQEMTLGDGPSPMEGDRVAVHYSLFYNGGSVRILFLHLFAGPRKVLLRIFSLSGRTVVSVVVKC